MATRRKNLYIVFGVLAVFLLSAIVYATLTGLLTFNGTALLNASLRVEFVNDPPTTPTIEGGVDTGNDEEVEVSASGQTLSFTVYLEEPGESKEVTFHLENKGTADAELTNFASGPVPSGLIVDWGDDILDGLVIDAGATDGPYSITVEWDIDAIDPADIGALET
ncbi:MAG: hypothetical protein LBB49_01510, partial [Gracilibacteraceae bacterium]|nr:hypothetical protein [Gracilibacteraceae bacterium]